MNRFRSHFYPKCKITVFLLLSVVTIVSSQKNNDNLISYASTEIVVDVLPGNDIFINHIFSKGNTVYNLAEIFQLEPNEIFAYNAMNPIQPIHEGKIVKIPIKRNYIVSNKRDIAKSSTTFPVFYIAKKGDTAYKLSHLFLLDQENFLAINDKIDESIKIGEKLLLGWYSLPDTKITKSHSSSSVPISLNVDLNNYNKSQSVENKDSAQQASTNLPEAKYYESDVIGWWNKAATNQAGYFVLHNEARMGSTIDIYNPMMQSHIKAKVIGRIPAGTYNDDVQIILSPNVAKDLKVLDSRYTVNIKFEK